MSVKLLHRDLDDDGISDLIWHNQYDGRLHTYLMNDSGEIKSSEPIAVVENLNWQIADILDVNGNGISDFFWRNRATDEMVIWLDDGNVGQYTPLPTFWKNL